MNLDSIMEKTTLREIVSAILAVIVVGFTVPTIVWAIISNPTDTTAASTLAEFLSPWVAVVLGFYFGATAAGKSEKKASQKADDEMMRADKLAQDVKNLIAMIASADDINTLRKTLKERSDIS